jgi:hypothetical protein
MNKCFKLPTRNEIKNTPLIFSVSHACGFCLDSIMNAYIFKNRKAERFFVSCSVISCLNLDIRVIRSWRIRGLNSKYTTAFQALAKVRSQNTAALLSGTLCACW